MDTILTNASDAELANAVQENLFALFRAMAAALPDSEIVESEKVSHHLAFPSNPMFKGLWRTRLSDAEADAVIDETLAWYKARQAPFIFWWTGPGTTPSDLGKRLEARGFQPNIEGDPGMAVDLHTLKEVDMPAGFKIVRASDQQTLEDWRDVFCAAYEVPAFAGQAWADATLRVGAANTPWQMYVGYLDGQPAATNILFNGAGVAGVYGVGTHPNARRKGIGAAITLKPLLEARAQGYRYGVLFSTDMGYPLYQRLGYHKVDCQIGRYIWFNPG
jgi:ribosomal protein S18 acetylase RimI-like enzyme